MNFREDKKTIIPVLLVLAAFIGWKSWKDMHPPRTEKLPVLIESRYYTRDEASLKALPDDGNAVVIWAGDITANDVAPSPIPPTSLPQREAGPLYTMSEIPTGHDAESVFKAILENTDLWRAQNNTFNAIYIDYTAKKPDLHALATFCTFLRASLKRKYWINVALRRDATVSAPDSKEWLQGVGENIQAFIFDSNEERKDPETLEQMIKSLEGFGAPYIIKVEEVPDYTGLGKALKDTPPKKFTGFMLDMTAIRHNTQ